MQRSIAPIRRITRKKKKVGKSGVSVSNGPADLADLGYSDVKFNIGGLAIVSSKLGSADDVLDSVDKRPVETTKRYYEDNWMMLQSQPELYTILSEYVSELVAKGVCFVSNGVICQPDEEFETKIINPYLIPALSRSFIWFMCFGFVIWSETGEGKNRVMFVPDPKQVHVDFPYDRNTGMTTTEIEWVKKDEIKSPLYIHWQTPLGISRAWRCAPLDAVSPLIDKLCRLEIARVLMIDRIARPHIAVQDAKSGIGPTPGATASDVPNLTRYETRQFMSREERLAQDALHNDRINATVNAANEALDDQTNDVEIPPWRRMENALEEPPENRFVTVPAGMQAATIAAPIHDLNYNETCASILRQIDRLLKGGPGPAPPPAGGGSSAPPAGSGGSDTKTMWADIMGGLATEMCQKLYSIGDIDGGSGKGKVKVMLMNRVMEDRDMCKKLVDQGAMSKDSYVTKHPYPPPPPETPANKK